MVLDRKRSNPGRMTERVKFYVIGQLPLDPGEIVVVDEPGPGYASAENNSVDVSRTPVLETWAEVKNFTSATRTDNGELLLSRGVQFTVLARAGFDLSKNVHVEWRGRMRAVTQYPESFDTRFITFRAADES